MHPNPPQTPAFTNRLAAEKSPYLLQHAHNPVDWFPWGEAAFSKARAEGKPIFLSIGYSTCHWCHVMERESFEVEAVGQFLNTHFVSIKVDREERPDVDKIYMTYVQATTGAGGWPMSVFLTPELKPFFGGTYFPPEPRHGRPSFLQLLERIAQLWRERRGDLELSAEQTHAQLAEAMTAQSGKDREARDESGPPPVGSYQDVEAVLRAAGEAFKGLYDPQHGGFGRAPKFPQPSQPQFLLRYAHRFGDEAARNMVLHTCERMAAGGIHDQLGGGFARYSVDAEWLVPHFEKMLYDNAQLVQLYLDAHLLATEHWSDGVVEKGSDEGDKATALQHSGFPFAAVVRSTLDYVLRDMTHPDGGFFSAEDADSEGHEGKFYCWTWDELSSLLTVEEFNVVVRHFGITRQGNFVDHSHPQPLSGQNVLSVVEPELSPDDSRLLASARAKMIEARAKRIRPHLDDKVLASWNGLMLGAFARAYAVLGDETYRQAAERNLAFLQSKLWDAPSKTLYHRWRDGERDSVQLLDAYAFLLSGVIELYEATLEPAHLEFALALAEAMMARFHDAKQGGFWQSADGATDLILRIKDDYDGAEPAGNSVATLALLKLAAITGQTDFRMAAEQALSAATAKLQQAPQAVPYLLQALDYWLDEPHRVVVAGEPAGAGFTALLQAAHSVYQPNKVVLGNRGPVEEFARTLPAQSGATVYLCAGQTCQPPTADSSEVRKGLRS
jgi:uncharacterized protein YyaL (SSP411 family)